MRLQEIMTKNVITAQPNTTVTDAAKIMQAHNVGAIPVCDQNKKVLGIITDRDIVVRSIANNGDPKTTTIDGLMTKEVVTAEPDMDAEEAARLMARHKIRRLPVVQNGRLVGIVAIGDLATHRVSVHEAAEALTEISQPSRPMNVMQ